MDLDTPRFTSPQVAKAAGFDINTFRSNFRRGLFRMVGKTDLPAERHGRPHLFALRDALGFAVAAELIRSGVSPAEAWEIGLWKFAHTGSADRNPGELFDYDERGLTILLYWPSTKTAAIIPMTMEPTALGFSDLFVPNGICARAPAVLAVTLNFIHRDVIEQLEEQTA